MTTRVSLFLTCLWNTCISGFNIDTKIPFVRTGPVNSYFGFSIAEHQITNSGGDVIENVLLVGSPKLNNPLDPQRNTGGLFKCSFNSWCNQSCEIQIQAEADDISTVTGTRSDQWFGSTVRSSGRDGHVIVCAHRFSTNYAGVGKCVSLHKSLYLNKVVMPCQQDPLEHAGESFCQVGTSALITGDGTAVIGCPGALHWTGGVSTLLTRRQLEISYIYYKSDWEYDSPFEYNSYLGYSVSSGNYGLGPRKFVGGAPHSNITGQVMFFVQETGGYLKYDDDMILQGTEAYSMFGYDLATLDLNNDGFDDLVVGAPFYYKQGLAGGAIYVYMGGSEGISNGTIPVIITHSKSTKKECSRVQCAESRFGSALSLAGDINADTYEDLVVGAPYEDFGTGAIYIFHGSKYGIVEKYTQRISGKDIDKSMKAFGYAITGGMDLDNNGYDDIAVGSYYSDKVILLRTRPVVYLKSKLNVNPQRIQLWQLANCIIPGDDRRHYCFEMKICVSLSAKQRESFNNTHRVYYKIEIDKDLRKPRAIFPSGGGTKNGSLDLLQDKETCITETLRLKDEFGDRNTPIGFGVKYFLLDNPYPNHNQCANGVPNINNYPVLQLADDAKYFTEVDFAKDCGHDNICMSNIVMTIDMPNLKQTANGVKCLRLSELGGGYVILDVNLYNRGEPAYQTTVNVTVPQILTFKKVEVLSSKDIPIYRLHETTISISDIHDPFGNQDKNNNERHYRLFFNPEILSIRDVIFPISVKVNTTSHEQSPGNDEQIINILYEGIREGETIDDEHAVSTNRTMINFHVKATPNGNLFYGSRRRKGRVLTKESEIGPAINYIFTVENRGLETIGESKLIIYWPYRLKGDSLLYLIQSPLVIEGHAWCEEYPEYLNPSDFQQWDSANKDLRYNLIDKMNGYPLQIDAMNTDKDLLSSIHNQTERIVKLRCGDTVECKILACTVSNLTIGRRVRIILRGRIQESTLIKAYPYPLTDSVWIITTGELILEHDSDDEHNGQNVVHGITVALPGYSVGPSKTIHWWIVFVSPFVGLLILFLLTLVLRKIGFFERKRPNRYTPVNQNIQHVQENFRFAQVCVEHDEIGEDSDIQENDNNGPVTYGACSEEIEEKEFKSKRKED